MSRHVSDWQQVGRIHANDSTVDLWRQSGTHIWRIVRPDGALVAPGCPTAKVDGVLIRRHALPLPNVQFGSLVRTHALSTGQLPNQ